MKRTPLFITVLVWCVLASLMLAIANELSAQKFWRQTLGGAGAIESEGFLATAMGEDAIRGLHPIVQQRLSLPPESPLTPQAQEILRQSPQQIMVYYSDQPLMTNLGNYLSPANASEAQKETGGEPELGQRRKPYQLLGADVLPAVPAAERKANAGETSQRCYQSDFQVRTEKVGNYLQRTNNYLRAAPDSCSAPRHELVGNFYELQPLA